MSSRPSLVDQTALTSTPYIMEKAVEDRAIAEPENSSTAVITLTRIKAAGIDKQRPLSTSAKKCSRCGKEPHKDNKCPAKDAVCHVCQKKGITARSATPRPSRRRIDPRVRVPQRRYYVLGREGLVRRNLRGQPWKPQGHVQAGYWSRSDSCFTGNVSDATRCSTTQHPSIDSLWPSHEAFGSRRGMQY